MSDGYVRIRYVKNVATSPYGIWEHDGSFTLETIITPYDCNGCGENRIGITSPTYPDGILDSQKTMPARHANSILDAAIGEGNYQDQKYLPNDFRNNYSGTGSNHKMMIFKSSNLQLYLENTTTHNHNQPAEYRIGCELKLDTTHTIISPTAIRARDSNYNLTDTSNSYLSSVQNLTPVGVTPSSNSQSDNDLTVVDSGHTLHVFNKMELYDVNGEFMGTIKAITNYNFVIDMSLSGYTKAKFDATDGTIHKKTLLEAPYLEGLYHIGLSYDDSLGKISIFINNQEIVSDIHVDRDNGIVTNFTFGNNDIYLGQDASLTYPANRKTQFMGEIHEIAITNIFKTKFSSLYTLLPQHRSLILYLTFEEV
tara:strand:- start:682 stop:1782 length:1101 start_codon:yes stop_codon:yes gene_type:complete